MVARGRGKTGRRVEREDRTYGPAAVRAEGILVHRSNWIMGTSVMEQLTWTSIFCEDGCRSRHPCSGWGQLKMKALTMWEVVKVEE